ncbi:MAG TPA: SPOR domain-containing protein [Nitrococcus sp.]|nr:SPOR domain-containing protein [Nitrococcus sp.]
MEQRAKQRLIGAVVLVALGVIFIPMLLKGPVERDRSSIPVEIPPQPRVAPVPDIPKADALRKPSPGQQLAENPPPVYAPPANSTAEVKSSAVVPIEQSRASAPALMPAVAGKLRGEDQQISPGRDSATASQTNTARAATGEALTTAWAVQVGSFQDRDNARALRQELEQSGFSAYVEQTQYKHKPLFRVRVGPVTGRSNAEQLTARLHEARGINGIVVKN